MLHAWETNLHMKGQRLLAGSAAAVFSLLQSAGVELAASYLG